MPQDLYKLPKGWEVHELQDLCEIKIGRTPPRSKSYLFQGDIPWATIADLSEEVVTQTNEGLIPEAVKKHQHKLVRKGTLLMSFKLTLGKLAFAGMDLFTNEAIAALANRDHTKLYDRYLYYSLQFIDLEEQVDNAVKGKTLNKKKLAVLHIPLPPLSQQKQIVKKLDALFSRIDDATARLNQILTHTQALFAASIDEIFSKAHSEFESKAIENLFTIRSGDGLTKKNMVESGEYLVYGGNGVSGHHDAFNRTGENIIIGRVGAWCGNVRFVKGHIWVTDNAFYVKEYKEKLSLPYLVRALRYLDLGSTANKAAQPVISYKGIRSLEIPLPPLQEQTRIVEHLDALSARIQALEKTSRERLDHLAALKASLLDAAFRGRL